MFYYSVPDVINVLSFLFEITFFSEINVLFFSFSGVGEHLLPLAQNNRTFIIAYCVPMSVSRKTDEFIIALPYCCKGPRAIVGGTSMVANSWTLIKYLIQCSFHIV